MSDGEAEVSLIAPRPAFVVSMHDVSPLTQDVFAAMLDDLRSLGLTKCSLLVIPDHHHRRDQNQPNPEPHRAQA